MGKNSRSYGLKRPSTAIFGTFGKKILGGGRKKKHYNHGIKVYMTFAFGFIISQPTHKYYGTDKKQIRTYATAGIVLPVRRR